MALKGSYFVKNGPHHKFIEEYDADQTQIDQGNCSRVGTMMFLAETFLNENWFLGEHKEEDDCDGCKEEGS